MECPPDPTSKDLTGPERMLTEAFRLWITPELERRIATKQSVAPIVLERAQVIFTDSSAPIVRINEEVRISLVVRANRAVEKGDPVYESDLDVVESFELDAAEADAGHFTIISWKGGWRIFFDFQRNKKKASDLVSLADDYLMVAQFALDNLKPAPLIDNLFSCCELLAKARLIVQAAEKKLNSHKAISFGINRWRKSGNVDSGFVDLFNKLSAERSAARYQSREIQLGIDQGMLDVASAEADVLRKRLSRFSDQP
ncbi:hypothetical protein [Rhodopseudomonas sp. BR0G17]|uniref:hypothetical protein n=1 Tax=unclassified Rhodopseudomonas TaxID=2638247 RepID=UPI0013DF818A|nr:hypothetical protein [Rhodopseudomonas sp. BR0G17]